MPKKSLVPKLPEPDRQQMLEQFLALLDQHPDLAHFRSCVRTGPDRQLALVAAFERSVLVGSPAVSPPSIDDDADQLLCDVLDVIDRHPDLKNHGAAYGPDRHLANLQALGAWRGTAPASQPTARELFATNFSTVTADPASDLPSSELNNSPPPQVFSPNGELIGPPASEMPAAQPPGSPQAVDSLVVVSIDPGQAEAPESSHSGGIIRHEADQAGEKLTELPADPRQLAVRPLVEQASSLAQNCVAPSQISVRPLRRGRPVKLDDLAKGRLLGLMSYGLSFRQAAAQLGVHHQTLLNALKRDEQFAQQVSEARLDAISQPLLTVVHASRTNWRAAAWLAKFLDDRRTCSYETTPEERALESRLRS
jgi:hypothetical protein